MILNPPDLTDQVNDIQWSPHTSTLFADVCNDGRFEIWDIALNSLNPIITNNPSK